MQVNDDIVLLTDGKEAFPEIESVECTLAKIAPPLGGKIDRVSVTLIG